MKPSDIIKAIESPTEQWKIIAAVVLDNKPLEMSVEAYAKLINRSKGWTAEMLILGRALKTNPRMSEDKMSRSQALEYVRKGKRVSKLFGD